MELWYIKDLYQIGGKRISTEPIGDFPYLESEIILLSTFRKIMSTLYSFIQHIPNHMGGWHAVNWS
jgi:hypothetical protein